ENAVLDSERNLRQGEQLMVLLRASQNLVKMDKEEDLLASILDDAVKVLDAQRGSIVLVEGPEQKLRLRALAHGKGQQQRHRPLGSSSLNGQTREYSHSLATRCVGRGESILCQRVEDDSELAMARSIAEGTMASVLCVLLRTPRKRLGVLHLDRGPW